MSAPSLPQRALELFDVLVELVPAARAQRLQALAAADPALHAEVAGLLAADDADGVLEHEWVLAWAEDDGTDEDSPDPMLGQRIGAWRILGIVGRGGMGAVYRGERAEGDFQQQAAIKLIRLGMDRPELRKRFLRERQILARLQHPNIAALHDGGVADNGAPYFAMELIDGEPIDRWCDAQRLDVHERVRLFLQVCAAVQHAHQSLIVHRDLKPNNILVTPAGQAKLLDFGIAKLLEAEDADTQTRDRPLTPEYAAPEQVLNEPITTATDLYTLGVVLYGLLAGAHPFASAARTPLQRQLAWTEREPEPIAQAAARLDPAQAQARQLAPRALAATLRGDLGAVVHRCLQAEPERRYASAEALATDLRAWLDGRPIAARRGDRRYRMRKFVARHRWGVAAGVAAVCAIGVTLAAALWQAEQARTHAALAAASAQRAEHEATQAKAQTARVKKVKEFLASVFMQTDPLRRAADGPIDLDQAFDATLKRAGAELAGDPVLQADVFDDFGETRAGQGRFDEAQALFEKALAVAEKAYGPDHPVVAETLVNLGTVAHYRDRTLEGAPYLERALAILERDAGNDPLALAAALTSLGTVRRVQGRLDDSARLLERALALQRTHGSPDSLDFAHTLNAYALIDQEAKRFAEAEAGLRQAIAIVEKRQGPDAPLLWPNLSSLAQVMYWRGTPGPQELELTTRALDLARKNFAGDHPWTAASLMHIGWLHSRADRFALGEPLLAESIAMFDRLRSRHAIIAARQLGISQQWRGDLPASLRSITHAWQTCRNHQTVDIPDCLSVRSMRAHLLAMTGECREALTELDALEAQPSFRAVAGVTERGDALIARADALYRLGRKEEAFAVQDRAIELARKHYGGEHDETKALIAMRERFRSGQLRNKTRCPANQGARVAAAP